jgi:hypothetical protein
MTLHNDVTNCIHCNKELLMTHSYVPCYDDGGGLDALDVVAHVDPCYCKAAVKEREDTRLKFTPTNLTDDELPF